MIGPVTSWRITLATVLILTLGSRGDVQPYVALGAVLAARGHAVTLSTGQGFDDLIAAHGLPSAPLSIDVQSMIQKPEIQAAMTSVKGKLDAFRMTKDLMQRQLDEIWSVAREIAPQVIVYHPKAFTAPYLARALGAIAIPGYLQPAYVPTGAFPNPVIRLPKLGVLGNRLSGRAVIAMMRLVYRNMLRRWFPRHPEVASRPGLDVLHGYRPGGGAVPRLHAHSRHLVPKPPDWGPDDHVTGYWFSTAQSSWQAPTALADFLASGPPPVYVGFGSMPPVDANRTLSVVLESLRHTKTRAVLATGWGALADPSNRHKIATEDIHVVDSAPHGWLFPQCSAVVHHGGAGTTHEGLRWGRPTLICPVFGDQPFWGGIVEKLGAGPASIPLKDLSEARLSAALRELRSTAFVETALSLGERLRTETGADTAAELISQTAKDG